MLLTTGSRLLEIKTTKYGGRGYFALESIPSGTTVLECRYPFFSIIYKPFKKEVCANCFAYDQGRTWKFKLCRSISAKKAKSDPAYAGLYFCSESCRDCWSDYYDSDQLLSATLETLEVSSRTREKRIRKSADPDSRGIDLHESEQADLEKDCVNLDLENLDIMWALLENSKNMEDFAEVSLDEVEYDFARVVAFATVQKARGLWSASLFDQLQSNELEKLTQCPTLVTLQQNIYKFLLTSSLPKQVAECFDSSVLRLVLGREAGNAFGIWEQPLTKESECFGTSVYPEASFFNHYCVSEVSKARQGPSMVFTASQSITAGEEMHISYGMIEQQPFDKRQLLLKDQWHFSCSCPKCLAQK